MKTIDINDILDAAEVNDFRMDGAQYSLSSEYDRQLERLEMRMRGYSPAEIKAMLSVDAWGG